jgi:hypothetical protein
MPGIRPTRNPNTPLIYDLSIPEDALRGPYSFSLLNSSRGLATEKENAIELDPPGETESSPDDSNARLISGGTFLACPYSKRYSESNGHDITYRKCSSCIIRTIARLKQHLDRAHRRPRFYCPRCFETFESGEERDAHGKRQCQPRKCPFEGQMTHDQEVKVKKRHTKEDPITAWFRIYGILFPGSLQPRDPFPDSSAQTIQGFCAYFVSTMPSLLVTTLGEEFDLVTAYNKQQEAFKEISLRRSMENLVERVQRTYWQSDSGESEEWNSSRSPDMSVDSRSPRTHSGEVFDAATRTPVSCHCLGNATAPMLLNMIYQGLYAGYFSLDGDPHRDQVFLQACLDEIKNWLRQALGHAWHGPEGAMNRDDGFGRPAPFDMDEAHET